MFRFIESIKVENHQFLHLDWHVKRVHETYLAYFGCLPPFDLKTLLHLPETLTASVYKCRVIYAQTVESVEFIPYSRKSYSTLRLVPDESIRYPFKYENRLELNRLFEQRGRADDVLITQAGYVTDTSISNVVFRWQDTWFTPTTYLLNGTCRQRLLAEGRILEKAIKEEDLSLFSEIRLINTMISLEDAVTIRSVITD